MANPYEHNARERKAQAIAGALWAALTRAERAAPNLTTTVDALDHDARAALANSAGCKAPSPETWSRVVAILGERQGQEGGPDLEPEGEPEAMEDATDTMGCPACTSYGMATRGGGCGEVPGCYRGRFSGWTGPVGDEYLKPCSPAQRAAVDAYLERQPAGVR